MNGSCQRLVGVGRVGEVEDCYGGRRVCSDVSGSRRSYRLQHFLSQMKSEEWMPGTGSFIPLAASSRCHCLKMIRVP